MALHEILTDAQLAELCHSPDRILINPHVVKISDEAVIKFGWLQPEEAENFRIAGGILDPAIVRVPKFYRFFTHGSESYLVMEYIKGRTPSESEYEDLVDEIINVLRHFRTFHGDSRPGSLSGRISCGPFWESDYPNFQTMKEMEDWLNKRAKSHPKISLQGRNLVLCHLDLAPRNIIRKDDGTLYLVDWESAGYYPEGFELAGLELKSTNATKFEYMLQEKLGEDLGADDSAHTESKTILEAWLGGDRAYFKPTEISNWRRCPTLDIRAYMIRNGFLPKAVAPTPSIPPSAAKHKTTTQYLGPLLFAVFRTDLNGINVKMISLRAGLQARLQAHGLCKLISARIES